MPVNGALGVARSAGDIIRFQVQDVQGIQETRKDSLQFVRLVLFTISKLRIETGPNHVFATNL